MNDLLNLFDYERRAAELLPKGPLGYFSAGAGDEWTLRENVNAYRRWTLRPRLLPSQYSGQASPGLFP